MCNNEDQWSRIRLSSETIQSFERLDEGFHEVVEGELGRLIKQLKDARCTQAEEDVSNSSRFGEWRDIFDATPTSSLGSNDLELNVCRLESHGPRKEKHELNEMTSSLLRVFQQKSEVSLAMKITSLLSEDDLRIVVPNVWMKLKDDAEKSLFISHLSSSFASSKTLCDEIIFNAFQDEEAGKSVFALLKPHVMFLDSSIVSCVVVRLLQDPNSIFFKDLDFFDDFFIALSESQKTMTLRLFCGSSKALEQWQLPILEKIMEKVTLTADSVRALTEFLDVHIDSYSRDRYMGSVLLHFLAQLSKASTRDAVQSSLPLFTRYKGILQVRIRAELDKI